MRIGVRTLKKKLTLRIRVRIRYRVKLFRIKPERTNLPTNLTLDPEVKAAAVLLARELGYRSLSEWVSELLESEIRRNASLAKTDVAAAAAGARAGRSPSVRRRTSK